MTLAETSPLLGSAEIRTDFASSCEAAKKQKFLPDDTDTIGQLFYLMILNPSLGHSALKSRHVDLIRQYKQLNPPRSCLERNSCQIMGGGGVAATLLGGLTLKLLASHYYLAAVGTGVATVATGVLAYIGLRVSPKDTLFIQHDAREELKQSYKKIADKLVALQEQNPSLAKKIARELPVDIIQYAINSVTRDQDYASTICSPLRDAKKLVLTKTSPLPEHEARQSIHMHDIL